MSRIIQQIATVQFQVDNRKVTASMNALQTEAESLNGKIAAVKQSIKDLGDVPADNKFLLDYQKQLRQLDRDLKDVKTSQRDLMKGVKAADQLWKAAATQDIESLSIKAIKAGQNGLRKRMENLRPELGGDEQKMYDAYKAVIDEADRVMNVFKSNYATVVQTIRDGGIVSEQAMKSTRDALRDLMEAEKEGTAEHRQLAQQYDFLNESLANVAEMRRREKGEIVNASDAHREALKLTEDGIAAARRERDMADAVIAGMQQQKDDLDQLRRFHEDRIAQTEREIAANQRLEEAEQDRLADVEKAMHYTENEDRKEAIRLRKKADAARDEAEAKKEAYEEQAEQEKLLRQHVKDTGDEVTALTAKIEALGKTDAPKNNPVLDGLKHEADVAASAITQLEERLKQLKSPDSAIKPITVENALTDRLGVSEGELKISRALNNIRSDAFANGDEATVRAFLRAKEFTGIYDKDSMSDYRSVSKKDIISQLTEYISNRFSGYDVSDDTYGIASGGKYHDMDWLDEITEKERQKFVELSYEKQKAWVERVIKKQFGEIDAILYQGANDNSAYVGKGDSALMGLRSVMNAEVWKGGKSEGPVTQTELDAQQKLITTTKELIQQNDELAKTEHLLEVAKKAKLEIDEKITQAQQQSTTVTNDLAEAEKLYNQKVEERIRLEKELEAIKNRSWEDDPEIKHLDKEIAKLDELIAVSDKYKKQFAKMSDSKFEEGYMGGDSEVRKALYIESDPQKSIWGAADYLKGAYHDRSRASLAESVKEKYPDDGIVTEYQQAAERVAKGIVQNAQENFRRAIYKEIQDGNWTSEVMEQQLDIFRSQFQNEFRNARPGELKDDPEYHYYKYVIEQMEKYIEVARQVEAEREKIAGGKEYIEMARRKDDIDQPQEGLLWQRQKRDWDRSTIKTEDIDRRRIEDERVATEAVTKAKGEEAEAHRKLNEVKKQSTTATNDQTEAIKKQEEELGKLEQKLKRLEGSRDGYQNDVKESLKAVKDMGLTEEDLADDAKVREAVEKKVLEIMEAQAKVGQEIAEQRKKLAGEVKMSDLGGTKADQEFYAKNKDRWDVGNYASPDDMIERIAHLERLKKLKNGKRFNPDEDWEDDDELDEDAPIMSDKEKQAINDELRFLKQHIREELLKTIKELGDIDKAVEQYTGGDGVSEDAKFGEQLNDKISEIKDKIEERIETTLDRYGEMLTEDRDEDTKLTKEQLTSHVSQHMESVKENHGFNRSWLEETQGDIETTKGEIESKKQLIDQMKQQTAATKESTQADQHFVDVSKQKAELEEKVKEKTKEHTKAVKDYEAQQEKTNKAQEKAYKAQEESVALNEKAATAEEKVAHQEERHAEAMDQQSERLRQIRAEEQRLLTQYEQQKTEIQAVDKAWADADVKQGEADARKAQNQELTIKSLDDSIRKLKEANAVIDTNSDEWEENTRIIRKLQQAQDEISQKQKEMMGEWMSYAEAEKFAAQAGTEGFIATGQQMQQAQQALERRRDALIKSIQVRRQEKNMTDEQKKALAAEEAQLDKVNAELKKMKFEMDNTNMSAKRMKEILDNPSAAKNIEELGQAVKRAQAQLKMMEDTVGNTNKEYQEMAQKTKEAAQRQKELEVQFKASASTFDKAWSRLKTYVGLYVGASVAMNKLTGTMGDLIELSDKMGEVRKTTGFTADEVGRLSGELKKFDTRTTLNGLLDLSVAAGQLGLKTEEDVLGFTEAANKLMVALPEMGREGATEMLKVALATGEIDKIRKQMEQGLVDGSSATAVAMEKVGSTIDRLRATSAATAPAITDFVKRVGAVGAQSGITIDQVAALGSTVDALGMRVEMSATALSRMIPAIKNNAYQIGAMIGQTEESIVSRFENGQGMDVILDIFQSIRDNSKMMTGDVEADAEAIEQAFEGAGLKDVMKELNQQGARAGIVFAGLSQNVDELRKHLDTAADAYEENIAIEMEYMKMNETTAAKWERLKNQIEEFFVSDSAQRFLGGVIDLLRDIVDWLTGNNGIAIALRTIIAYMAVVKLQLVSIAAGALKAVGGGLKNIGIMLGFIKGEMTKIQWGNVFMAAAAAVWYLVVQLRQLWKDLHATETIISETLASYNSKVAEATQKTEKLFEKVGNARVAMKDATEEVKKAEEALKKTKEAMNAGKASAEDLEKAELNLKVAHEKETQASKDHYDTIRKINQEYSPYLGYLLSEISTAAELANARELINAKLRETILLKQKEAAYSRVESEFGGERDKRQSAAYETIGENVRNPEAAARLRKDLMNLVKQEADKEKMNIVEFRKDLNKAMSAAGGDWSVTGWEDFESEAWRLAEQERKIRDAKKRVDEAVDADIKTSRTGTESTKGTQQELEEQLEAIYKGDDDKDNGVKGLAEKYKKAGEKDRKQIAANLLMQMDAYETLLSKSKNFFDLKEEDEEESYKTFIANSDKRMKDLGVQRDDLLKIAGDAYKPIQDNGKDKDKDKNKGRGPYGNYDKRVDPYEQWDANALVKRREDMLMRVRALAGGADVQQVLSMDKRFMDEATRKGIKNMRDAIAWYNTERLKIQEELDSRNLTNEGQWKDPKKGRSRKPKTPESEEAIAELDRYYLERKERIEEARANEEMTEAEYNRRLDALEQEHLERRSALRQTFTSKDKQFIQQFRQWWASVEELDEVSWETIEAEWIAAFDRDRKYNDRAAQKDLTQMQAIVVKQLREIESIIDKERPFNGITRNLQDNLTKMGLLFKDGMPEGDKFMQENTHRLTFLLKEAEDAYNMTFDQLAEDMRKNGLGAWADAIINSENAEKEKRAVIAQLHEVYDAVQEAIKKEASLVKKQVDITWNDALLPNGKSIKATYEAAISQLGVQQNSVSRANSLIGAGMASERVADRLALRQMRLQLQMQEHYFNLVRQTGMQRIADLKEQARLLREQGKTAEAERLDLDAKHSTMSLNLSLSKEETELAKQREDIIARTEESQNRLYTELREWADLLTSSLQGVMEASHTADREYYNELAKLNLTGKGGPGAGTYIVIDNEGTSDAKAHYEYLDERQALERQREIENDNAVAEAWKKMLDDLNKKMSDTITDQLNAMLQNASIDANTQAINLDVEATDANTQAVQGLTQQLARGITIKTGGETGGNAPRTNIAPADNGLAADRQAYYNNVSGYTPEPTQPVMPEGINNDVDAFAYGKQNFSGGGEVSPDAQQKIADQNAVTDNFISNKQKEVQAEQQADRKMAAGSQSMFAKMTQAANLYGIAYQAMSNDNLSTTQKFEMMALQAVGNYAIGALTTEMAAASAKAATDSPGVLGTLWKQLGWAAAPVFAIFTGLLGGLMGLASSKIGKAKSQIAQATGTSASAGKLSMGMLTYKNGNVDEFTDPATLTPGRSYNVDAADGKTYRAKYTGRNPRTHITNGPEFHLAGEAGREMIIDAGTTRQITMNEAEIWHAIKTLSGGGRLSHSQSRRSGMRAFADGNVDDFEEIGSDGGGLTAGTGGISPEQMAAFQSSLDRNNELLERALTYGIKAVNKWDGPDGIPNMYNRMQKEAKRHGVSYL